MFKCKCPTISLPRNLSLLGSAALVVIVIEWLTTTKRIIQCVGEILRSADTQGGNGSLNSTSTENDYQLLKLNTTPPILGQIVVLAIYIIFFLTETCACLGFILPGTAGRRKTLIVVLNRWCRLYRPFLLVMVVLSFCFAFVNSAAANGKWMLGSSELKIGVFEVWILLKYAQELQDQEKRQRENIIRVV